MNTGGEVLLARPHPFIVADMAPFLSELGFAPVRLTSIQELASMTPGAAGAVVSLAVGSSIPQSAAEVFAALRGHDARVPVLFASLLDFEGAKVGLAALADKAAIRAQLIGVDSDDSQYRDLGKADTFVYVAKVDLQTPGRRASVVRILRRHFR